MLVGPQASQAECDDFKLRVQKNPRNYIAQPMLGLSRVPTIVDDVPRPASGGSAASARAESLAIEGRHVDLRPYVLYGEDIFVLPGGPHARGAPQRAAAS